MSPALLNHEFGTMLSDKLYVWAWKNRPDIHVFPSLESTLAALTQAGLKYTVEESHTNPTSTENSQLSLTLTDPNSTQSIHRWISPDGFSVAGPYHWNIRQDQGVIEYRVPWGSKSEDVDNPIVSRMFEIALHLLVVKPLPEPVVKLPTFVAYQETYGGYLAFLSEAQGILNMTTRVFQQIMKVAEQTA